MGFGNRNDGRRDRGPTRKSEGADSMLQAQAPMVVISAIAVAIAVVALILVAYLMKTRKQTVATGGVAATVVESPTVVATVAMEPTSTLAVPPAAGSVLGKRIELGSVPKGDIPVAQAV